jgi:hypothetical protein
VSYLKGALSAIAAITVALLGPSVVMAIRYQEKATGLAVFTAELLSPVFWLSVLAVFGLFWMAGRLANKFLRILLFWIPATSISAIGCIALTFILYVIFRFRGA